MHSDKDKLGFFKVGDFKTYSKVEALELADYYKKTPTWNFNQEVFSAYDWKKEPKESISELYARRARQLRDNYDYIVIFYSGGADSGNVVDTFVDNNISFEEIATYNYHELDHRKNSFFHGEQTFVSYPKIDRLKKLGINFRHRPVDLSSITKEILESPYWTANRIYHSNSMYATSHLAKTFIREKTPDYMKIIESGKKLVFVWGADKPHLVKWKENFFVEFGDYVDAGAGTRTQIVDRDWEHDELFYWSPDAADLICKQIHIVKNFVQTNMSPDFNPRTLMTEDPIVEPHILNLLASHGYHSSLYYRNLLNWLVYPKFNFDMYSAGKPPLHVYAIFSPREEFWLKDRHFRAQSDLLSQAFHSVKQHWWLDKDRPNAGFHRFTNRYEV